MGEIPARRPQLNAINQRGANFLRNGLGEGETFGALQRAESLRREATDRLDPKTRSALGQFMTPGPVASFMAGLFGQAQEDDIRLLDAGAGVGSLTAAFVVEVCRREHRPRKITATLYEPEPILVDYLRATLEECRRECAQAGIEFSVDLKQEDFIVAAVDLLRGALFQSKAPAVFTHTILNPPYKKVQSISEHRKLLSSVGVETSNLYTAFLALALLLLEPGGEMVSITPRSFCNGPYFRPFRELLFSSMRLRRVHVFEARDRAFQDDDVLQENIILHAVKGGEPAPVLVSSSLDQSFDGMTVRECALDRLVRPDDPHSVLHVTTSTMDEHVLSRLGTFKHSLKDLGVEVSTGPVVDFRLRDYIRDEPGPDTVPLIYPLHFVGQRVAWPKTDARKPDFIEDAGEVRKWLMPNGYYTVVRRLSSKEERRRIVAALYDPSQVKGEWIGFENHLNVLHSEQAGLAPELARGLTAYLNSSLVDAYFRQFNGHTQVNATDLRVLPYPSREELVVLGACMADGQTPTQERIDTMLEGRLQQMAKITSPDPVRAQQKIEEALTVLKVLDFPRAQQNVRSALTLLALLDLKPETPWGEASAPLMGITPIMDFARDRYGKEYAPNSRETFRRFTMHQFVQAGMAVPNPDQPERPTNSPNWCYQVDGKALAALRAFDSPEWEGALDKYLQVKGTLSRRYGRERDMRKVPVRISEDQEIHLTPGKHSELIKAILEEFAPRFAPGAVVVYAGDTGDKWGFFNEPLLKELGVAVDTHGKMPDAVLYFPDENWLLLIEAVTSHGPVDPKRRIELKSLFETAEPGLVYVTAFPTRAEMARYLPEISWETEVWVAEAPTHLIHFNGERFLGPYEE